MLTRASKNIFVLFGGVIFELEITAEPRALEGDMSVTVICPDENGPASSSSSSSAVEEREGGVIAARKCSGFFGS